MNHKRIGKVFIVGGGPGDPGLLTIRGLECLRQADVVIYDRLVSPLLLEYAPQAEKVDVGKRTNHHPVPQDGINKLMVEKASAGKIVVRLKGGDPFLFGRGGEEALVLVDAGIPFEIVPGVCSGIAVPAYAGIPVTHRGMSASVAFITAHKCENDPNECLEIPDHVDTLVFFMGVKNLPKIVAELIGHGKPAQLPVAVIQQGTTNSQKTIVGNLSDITTLAANVQPPAIIIVGEVVRLHNCLNWFENAKYSPMK